MTDVVLGAALAAVAAVLLWPWRRKPVDDTSDEAAARAMNADDLERAWVGAEKWGVHLHREKLALERTLVLCRDTGDEVRAALVRSDLADIIVRRAQAARMELLYFTELDRRGLIDG